MLPKFDLYGTFQSMRSPLDYVTKEKSKTLDSFDDDEFIEVINP